MEKLGRNDPRPCGSTKRFQELLYAKRRYDGSLRDYYFPRVRPTLKSRSAGWRVRRISRDITLAQASVARC